MNVSRGWRRMAGAGLLTAAAVSVAATWPTAASADAPVRTGWWNTMSGGGQSAPSTTPDGALHVAVTPGQILAYSAVLYSLEQDATATLELKLSGQGTPVLEACPTKDLSWKEGGNQPTDAAPAYDCSLHSYHASISADGATATFLLDGGAETIPGQLSLAILPYMTHDAPGGVGTELPTDSTQPFSVDIAKPDVSSLTVTSTPTLMSPPSGTGAGTTTGGTSTSTGTSTAGGAVPTPQLPDSGTPPVGATGTTPDAGTAPQVAPPTGTAPSALTPTAAGGSAQNTTAHNVALALLVLLATFVLGSGTTTMQRAPRLLGGAGKHAARTAGTAAAAAAAAPAVPVALLGVRGLGRFAKARTEAPRPLV